MSSFCTTHIFFSKNTNIYAIFNDQSFNDTLTNDIISFEQLGPSIFLTSPCEVATLFILDCEVSGSNPSRGQLMNVHAFHYHPSIVSV